MLNATIELDGIRCKVRAAVDVVRKETAACSNVAAIRRQGILDNCLIGSLDVIQLRSSVCNGLVKDGRNRRTVGSLGDNGDTRNRDAGCAPVRDAEGKVGTVRLD